MVSDSARPASRPLLHSIPCGGERLWRPAWQASREILSFPAQSPWGAKAMTGGPGQGRSVPVCAGIPGRAVRRYWRFWTCGFGLALGSAGATVRGATRIEAMGQAGCQWRCAGVREVPGGPAGGGPCGERPQKPGWPKGRFRRGSGQRLIIVPFGNLQLLDFRQKTVPSVVCHRAAIFRPLPSDVFAVDDTDYSGSL